MTADYSQIEMRIMADLSGDDALVEAFCSGFDFHATTAASVFGVPLDAVDGVLRNRVKAMNYGLAYGLSAYGLSQQLGISADEARTLDGRVLRAVRRRARLPQQGGRTSSARRLHRNHHGSPSLPARPEQRQPAAPRDGRADGAQRADPGQCRRHHQGRDAQRRPRLARQRAQRRGCCCRCTTNSSSRSHRANGPTSRSWCAARWQARIRFGRRSTSRLASVRSGTPLATERVAAIFVFSAPVPRLDSIAQASRRPRQPMTETFKLGRRT